MRYYRITTAEQVHFRYELAGLVSRAMAWTLDQILLTVLRGVLVASVGAGGALGFAMIMVGLFVLDFGYYVFFELYWAGQSIGKRFVGLRVVSAGGGKLQFADVLIRNLLRPLDTLPLCMMVGGTVAFLDPLRRRLGDMAAETLVIRDARAALPEGMLKQHTRENTFQTEPAIRNRILTRVTREERDLILDLVLRRDELDVSVRRDLFAKAARLFRKRYSLPDDLDYLTDEQTVINIALVLQSMKFTA